MEFTYTPEQEAWRRDVRAFFEKHLTQELIDRRAEDNSQYDAGVYQEMVDAGFLGAAMSKEVGGQGRSYAENAIFTEELVRAHTPWGLHGVFYASARQVANAIGHLGTKEQKDFYLSRIRSGEHTWTMGLTETGCGSDLASVATLAIEDGDEFVVTGNKSFNSAHITTHMFMVVRTNPNAPKHKGISLLLMDLRNPGISISPFYTMAKWRRNTVYFDGVRVPRSCLLGRKDMGWYDLMSIMHLERAGAGAEFAEQVLEELVEYVKHTQLDGRPLDSYSDVRQALAEMKWELTVARLLTNRVVWLQETGQFEEAHVKASLQKVYVSEAEERVANRAMEVIGLNSVIEFDNANNMSKALSLLRGTVLRRYKDCRLNQIAGGPNEIQRCSIIARRGLGLPM